MRIAAFALQGNRGWPDLQLDSVAAGLNVLYGPPGSAKTTAADLIGHAICGRRLVAGEATERAIAPEGELVVESGGSRYRLRRYHDSTSADRLTVAALDGAAVDRDTVRQLVCGLTPSLAAPIYVIGFHEPPRLEWLLSAEFARDFQAAIGGHGTENLGARQAELIARRDVLAKELEARIAGQRQTSQERDHQWHALDHEVREQEKEIVRLQQRLRGIAGELAEIQTYVRHRQLELSVGEQGRDGGPAEWRARLSELDDQINRWRATLAQVEERHAKVQSRVAQVRPDEGSTQCVQMDQRACLAVTRELAADLQGQVARLARASETSTCVCGDAHPRLRPIVETLLRQLAALDALADQQDRAVRAAELREEANCLARSQAEIRNQLEHLLDCRQRLGRALHTGGRPIAEQLNPPESERGDSVWRQRYESRQDLATHRTELERERGALHDRLELLERQIVERRARRDAAERERAAAPSAREIETIQREFATVQQELERVAETRHVADRPDGGVRASDFLAQLTDGELVQVQLPRHGRIAYVVNSAGDSLSLESLSSGQRDQVYLSLCLALISVLSRHGARLPLVLDEPFLRLDNRATAAMTAVLDDFSRHGHQVLVFTAREEAVNRFAAREAAIHDMLGLQHGAGDPALGIVADAPATIGELPKRRRKRRHAPTETDRTSVRRKRREAG